PDDGLETFTAVRSRLFGIAYRILRRPAEAEDVVQEVWMRWHSTNRSAVMDPTAFLARITARLCINVARSSRLRQETSIENALFEPVDLDSDPGLSAQRSQQLGGAMLVLLEKLSPAQRAAFILRTAFDYSYRQIADLLQLEEAHARQLVSRA